MPVPVITPEVLAQRLQGPASGKPVLLDVRNPDEHAYVALPGSILIPLHELQARADELEPLRGKEVVVYCHHGVRSLSGAAFLLALGIEASSLAGGIDRYARTVDASLRVY
jgi:rhodanese-related sulfurtransferase